MKITSKTPISNYHLIFLFFLFITLSCRELVTDKFPDYSSSPTVNSILVAGKSITINLSMAGKLDSLPLPAIINAEIELFIDGKFFEDLKKSGEGNYMSSIVVEPLKTYTCKVIIPDEDTIVCNQTLPEPNPIIKIEHMNIAGRDQEGTTYPAVKLTFKNDLSVQRYYEVSIRFFVKHHSWGDEEEYLESRFVQIPTITDPVLLNEGLSIMLFSNELIQDSSYTMILNYSTGQSSSSGGSYRTTLFPFVVELHSVTSDYYHYKKQYYLYEQGTWADGLTNTTAPSPLFSNIENGYGIFAGYSVFATDTITPEPYED
jgi:hypothetical protein